MSLSDATGANPMRWDCQRQGCFNVHKRPKIELFADCLPGRIAFGDVDGIVEINGNLLLLEWKDHQSLNLGQKILFERLTLLCPATVFIVEGDAETMTVTNIRPVWRGDILPIEPADLAELKRRIRAWAEYAMENSAIRQAQGASCD